MRNLLITLGQNSSAILIYGSKAVCGYKESQLSHIPEDSAFPRLAIMKCLDNNCEKLDNIYISYWNDNFDIFNPGNTAVDKHYDRKFLKMLCTIYNCNIKYLSEELTHHDAHAYSALNYFENSDIKESLNSDFYVLVSDVYGNKEETISLYKLNNGKLTVIDKIYGYFSSLGLMLKNAMSFCSLDENKDDLKPEADDRNIFIDYKNLISDALSEMQIKRLTEYSNSFIDAYIKRFMNDGREDGYTTYINVSKIYAVKNWWRNEFTRMLTTFGYLEINKDNILKVKSIVSFFAQNIIEKVIGYFLDKHNIKKIIISGDVFNNSKLIDYILYTLNIDVFVPLFLDDEGAAMGIQRFYNGSFNLNKLI